MKFQTAIDINRLTWSKLAAMIVKVAVNAVMIWESL